MENGWTTGDVLWDVPIKIDMGGGELMQPRNYSGTFHGPVLFRDALADSYNIPPIHSCVMSASVQSLQRSLAWA